MNLWDHLKAWIHRKTAESFTTDKYGSTAVNTVLSTIKSETDGKRALSADRLAFGGLSTIMRFPDISAEFSSGVPSGQFDFTVVSTASTSIIDGKAYIETGTTPTSYGEYFSIDNIRYRPGSETYFLLTALFPTTGSTNDYALVGLQDDNDGYYFGFKNGVFGVGHKRDGVEVDFIPQSMFNGDLLDGSSTSNFKRDGEVEAVDFTKLNIFEIVFGYLGAANIDFRIKSPDGNWIVMHSIRSANSSDKPHSFNPNLPISARVYTASGSNMRIESSSVSAGVYNSQRDIRLSTGNSTTTPLGAGGVFTGDAIELLNGVGQISISFYSDQDSASGGVEFQFSHDTVTWKTATEAGFKYTAPRFARYQYGVNARYFRVKYTNGAVAQNIFSLQTLLLPSVSRTSIHRLGDNVSAERSVELVKAGITGEREDGTFGNVGLSNTNSIKVAITDRPSEVRSRVKVEGTLSRTALTGTATTVYTVTGGKTLYIESFVTTYLNSTNTIGEWRLRDGTTEKISFLAAEKTTGSSSASGSASPPLPEPIAFTTSVNLIEISGDISATFYFVGYEE